MSALERIKMVRRVCRCHRVSLLSYLSPLSRADCDVRGQETEAAKRAKREREAVQRDVKVEHWLQAGIIVKIVNKTLNDGKYHKRKGVVLVRLRLFYGHRSRPVDDHAAAEGD